MEPSQLGSLKGLSRTKDTGVYTGSAPCGEDKGLIQFEVVLLMSRLPGRNQLALAFDRLFLVLNRRQVIPLYTQVDAQWLRESQPAHKQCPAR